MSGNGTNGNGMGHVNGDGHDASGKFTSRNPGRGTKKLERDYFAVAKRACSERDWLTICRKAVVLAKVPRGAHPLAVKAARDFLLKALSLEQAVKVQVSGSLTTPHTDDVAKILADPEATARLLDAVQGPQSRVSVSENGNGAAPH